MWFDRRLVMRKSSIHGIGTFATHDSDAGELLILVTGELIIRGEDRLWGLERNALRAREAGVISELERGRCLEGLQQAAQRKCFFGTASGFGVGGVK
jgi:hypothetical protein